MSLSFYDPVHVIRLTFNCFIPTVVPPHPLYDVLADCCCLSHFEGCKTFLLPKNVNLAQKYTLELVCTHRKRNGGIEVFNGHSRHFMHLQTPAKLFVVIIKLVVGDLR